MDMNTIDYEEIPHSCMLQMQAVYENLKTAERKAADYLLARPREVVDLSIVDFAGRAGCSEATIVRLSKKLGYEGYPELKRDFAAHHEGDHVQEYQNIGDADGPEEILRKVFEASVQGIQDTLAMIDGEAYGKAVEVLLRSRRVMFTGAGDAGVVAMEAYQRFLRIGVNSLFSSDTDTQLIMASQLKEGDVLFAISHSGRTKSIVDVVKTARENGATCIALTNFPVSPLTKKCHIILQTAVFSKHITGEVMSKRITALCLIESLYINYLKHADPDKKECLKRSNEIVSINKL